MAMSNCKMSVESTEYYLSGTVHSDEADIAPPEWFVSAVHQKGSGSWGITDGCAWQGEEHERAFIELARGWEPGGQFSMARNHAHPDRVALHDFTFAPAKSVAVAWAMADEQTADLIEMAQARAVRWALGILAQFAICRLGKGGINKQPAEIVGVLFSHGASRSLDPHLHTHAVLMNMTPRSASTSAALDMRRVLFNAGVVASHYNVELANQLRELGFDVESTKEGGSFELAHVPAHVHDMFSTRRKVIENMVKRSRTGSDHVPHRARTCRAQYQRAVWATRTGKRHMSIASLRKRWRERAEMVGYDAAELFLQQRLKRGKAVHLPFDCLLEQAEKRLLSEMHGREWIDGRHAEIEVLKALTGWCNGGQAREVFQSLRGALLRPSEVGRALAWWDSERYVLDNKCAVTREPKHHDSQADHQHDVSSRTR